ncbi:hypothetical protein [Chengkuizengella marina]|uniref:Uncharacterized protein n=1 Tax=Chengkuizengella marina TaxID=2507566 RepID=A0A6N9PYF0_9BACL|nr:hypothetical protein [Chengkuizengella marina]NBI27453.1 hypothetical protein [Chengkuizengella marina]
MISNFKKISLLSLCFIFIFAGSVFAEKEMKFSDLKSHKDIKVLKETNSNIVMIPSEEVTDKSEYIKMINQYIPIIKGKLHTGKQSSDSDVSALLSANINDYDSMTYNGSTMYAQFDSTINYNICCTTEVSGDSRGAWLGSNPFNADKVTLADSISFTGVTVSVSVPASAGFSVSGSTASWTDSVNNTWQMNHYYNNISATGFDIYVSQSTSATFKFGSSFYTPTASDGTWL